MKKLLGFNLVSIIISISFMLIFITVYFLIKKNKEKKRREKLIDELDKEKNSLATYPIELELKKVETLIKNDKLEKEYTNWVLRFKDINENNLTRLNDLIIELDSLKNSKREEFKIVENKALKEMYIAKCLVNKLLSEIEDVNLSEEKYRTLITKLKAKYRELNETFLLNKDSYMELADSISLQFENIEKRFTIFEDFMKDGNYDEVIYIVKSVDMLISKMENIINNGSRIMMLIHRSIPLKIDELLNTYSEMIKNGYKLEFLDFETNMLNMNKKLNEILDNVKKLDFYNTDFELKTIADYLDSLFLRLDEEKLARESFKEEKALFEENLLKINKVVSDIYKEIDEIKRAYNLKEEDLKSLDKIYDEVMKMNNDYKSLVISFRNKTSYIDNSFNIKEISNRLNKLSYSLDLILSRLGNMYEDEERAKEQLNEMENLLRATKFMMRKYKLPSIHNDYYIELKEANESISGVIQELKRKPIEINTLNIRVDTARDLALKVYLHTKEMIFKAYLSENLILYANKFRYKSSLFNDNINKASDYFNEARYDEAINICTLSLSHYDLNIKDKVDELLKKNLINS